MVENKQVKRVLKILSENYPNLKYYLNFSNPVELLVAAILSAQVRDEAVNLTTAKLFKKYRSAKDFADAELKELTNDIKSITFAGNKAKNIKETCKILAEKYNGKVPKTVEELTELPGIGRKTANAILQNAYNIVEGVVVDTHVLRVSYRLGFTDTDKNAEKSEEQLMKLLPKSEWKTFPFLMKAHGRAICKAPVPFCSKCAVSGLCPKNGVSKRL